MATAKSDVKVVEKKQVVLTLSMAEARVLKSLLMAVGGSRENSLRGIASGVGDALGAQGIYGYVMPGKHHAFETDSASVYFQEGSASLAAADL